MGKILISLFVIVVIVSNLQVAFGQYRQAARLFSGRGCSGSFLDVPTNAQVRNLAQYNFDNFARSVSLVGSWIFYDLVDYNEYGDSSVDYIFQPYRTCVNLRYTPGYVSSVKFAGHPTDYRQSTITFFTYKFFQGINEEYVVQDLPNLSLGGKINSLIITGCDHWTVYTQNNYGGNGYCLERTGCTSTTSPAFLDDLLPYGIPTVASVRKGCYSTKGSNVISIPASSPKQSIKNALHGGIKHVSN